MLGASLGYPQRVAMISMHTSPLATPGVGDAGGLNVYVAEVARRLGERLGVNVETTAGTHAAYHDHPRELAEAIRPFFREFTALST